MPGAMTGRLTTLVLLLQALFSIDTSCPFVVIWNIFRPTASNSGQGVWL